MLRNFTDKDKPEVLAMVSDFYSGPGVIHKIPVENFEKAYSGMVSSTPYLRGLCIIHDGQIAGYIHLSFSYSCEAGGLVVWVEELYIKPEYRGLGLGGEALEFVKNEYRGKAARIRLEISPENTGAARLYKKHGFSPLDYRQMINDNF